MSEFKNVAVVKKANIYFEGKVTSRTVIFPDAVAKLFVTASPAERARRRWLELRAKGADPDLATVEREMRERDARDTARAAAPLKPADDAVDAAASRWSRR